MDTTLPLSTSIVVMPSRRREATSVTSTRRASSSTITLRRAKARGTEPTIDPTVTTVTASAVGTPTADGVSGHCGSSANARAPADASGALCLPPGRVRRMTSPTAMNSAKAAHLPRTSRVRLSVIVRAMQATTTSPARRTTGPVERMSVSRLTGPHPPSR